MKESSVPVLLTTGASERNKVLNIYDFAGNMVQQASVDGKAFFNVDKGLYIVSIDGNSLKVSAK